MPEPAFQFAEALRNLLGARTPARLEASWNTLDLETLGWHALRAARRRDAPRWERVLEEIDGLLLRLLDRVPTLAEGEGTADTLVRTFRLPALERLQHAAAAALVAQRFGPAGLDAVVMDEGAPVQRRYYALFTLAERHPPGEWRVFSRYLMPSAHHAFVGVAAEAARFYPAYRATPRLVTLFRSVSGDPHLRAFLSPRILQSLYVLRDARALPLLREILVAGHTAADPERCEIMRALVSVRRLTGTLEPSAKFADHTDPDVVRAVDAAESLFRAKRNLLSAVKVI